MKRYLDDILILAGCGVILYATYLLSGIAALYVGGGMLIIGGLSGVTGDDSPGNGGDD